MIVARPLNDHEPDLLVGFERQPLVVKDLDGKEIYRIDAPDNGWSHDVLESIDFYSISTQWDAYLGEQWVGSSEV
ncbi:TPA: hypothetical protein I7145_23125 [Vibrio vulnificus]|uniref:hypothetical protein n=1 Tax=Vibrio anguillarum TaxID=55601 RepID=UPI0002F8A682|nr:hypothetical protein [Vibrio anguillarum]HAS6097504.1 hypothetical protein [Vibrio vulnificus]HDM8041291.1 hypothetical protein [Vibrio fluvialis]